jgi:DNA-binding response OmpR family regulator
MRILVVEDELDVADVIRRLLEKNNYIVDVQHKLRMAKEAILNAPYSAVILDRHLPDGDGLTLLEKLREARLDEELPPFIILTAICDVQDRVEGLDAGAVDYMIKPYEPDELLARIRVCMKLKSNVRQRSLSAGSLDYDLATRTASINGRALSIRRRELAILDLLIRNLGRMVSMDALTDAVYGFDDIESNALTAHVSRLRKTLDDSQSGLRIRVSRQIGYTLEEL